MAWNVNFHCVSQKAPPHLGSAGRRMVQVNASGNIGQAIDRIALWIQAGKHPTTGNEPAQ